MLLNCKKVRFILKLIIKSTLIDNYKKNFYNFWKLKLLIGGKLLQMIHTLLLLKKIIL